MAKSEDKTEEFKKQFSKLVKDALNEIGTTGKADLMANCKVDTGTLRRGHDYEVVGDESVIFGNYVEYAPYVEFKEYSKGGRPWFRSTLESDSKKFNDIIVKYLGKVGD